MNVVFNLLPEASDYLRTCGTLDFWSVYSSRFEARDGRVLVEVTQDRSLKFYEPEFTFLLKQLHGIRTGQSSASFRQYLVQRQTNTLARLNVCHFHDSCDVLVLIEI